MLYALRVQNIDSLLLIFGSGAADAIHRAIEKQLLHHLYRAEAPVRFSRRKEGAYDIEVGESDVQRFGEIRDASAYLLAVCRGIATTPITTGTASFLAAPTVSKVAQVGEPSLCSDELERTHSRLSSTAYNHLQNYKTPEAFKADMAVAVKLVEELRHGQLIMAWQQVRSLVGKHETCHFNGALAGLSSGGSPAPLHYGETAMRRLGLASTLDLETIDQCLDGSNKPGTAPVAIEISLSTVCAHVWRLKHLLGQGANDVPARMRFVIRPDGYVDAQCIQRGLDVIRKANAEIGVIMSSDHRSFNEQIQHIRPDFLVIPSHFLRSILNRPENSLALSAIAALSQFVSPQVIIQGVDSQLLATHAINAGIGWGEGQFIAPASWTRVPRQHVSRRLRASDQSQTVRPVQAAFDRR